MDTNNLAHNEIDFSQFVNQLKKADKRASLLYNIVKIFYLLIMAFFLVMFVIIFKFSNNVLYESLNTILILSGLILVYIYLHYRGKDYKNADYSQTTYVMLQQTSERYKPFLTKDLLSIPGLVLMMLGTSLNSGRGFLFALVLLIVAGLVGVIIGFVWWYFKWKPIKDNADRMLREMES